jgi:hypothetical protein
MSAKNFQTPSKYHFFLSTCDFDTSCSSQEQDGSPLLCPCYRFLPGLTYTLARQGRSAMLCALPSCAGSDQRHSEIRHRGEIERRRSSDLLVTNHPLRRAFGMHRHAVENDLPRCEDRDHSVMIYPQLQMCRSLAFP